MQEGSIVVMEKPFEERYISRLLEEGIKRWPTPQGGTYLVTCIGPDFRGNTYLALAVDFPEIEAHGFSMLADMFREVMPPGEVNVSELLTESILEPA